MPLNEAQFEAAKESVLKTLVASRVTKSNIYWEYQRLKKLGIDNDNRKEIYEEVKKITLKDLETFFNTEVKNSKFDLLVIGNKKDINFSSLNDFGTVKEMMPSFLFNYDK